MLPSVTLSYILDVLTLRIIGIHTVHFIWYSV